MSITRTRRIVAGLLTAAFLTLTFAGCSDSEFDKREQQQEQKKQVTNTQEIKNLNEKIKRDEASAGKTGYVYVMSFGKFIGYYTIKGKISSNGSQVTPEEDIVCPYTTSSDCVVTDGPQDDGTYGEGDPGIFFFTTEGAMVVTDLDYLYADQPIASAIDVPKLNPKG